MTTILLIRHGHTDWNRDKRAQGQADVELNDDGIAEAERTARRLADLDIAAVYSSDLRRAVDTGGPIAEARGLEVRTDPDFREIDQGEWTGLPVDEIGRRWPELWGPARHYRARPGGESPADVRRRALRGLARVVEQHPDDTVVVVSHGGTIRWIVAEALGYDDRESATIRGLANGGVVSIEGRLEDGRLVLSNVRRMDGRSPDLDDPNQ